MSHETDIAGLAEMLKSVDNINRAFNGTSVSNALEKMRDNYDAIFKRFAPCVKGDRVVLSQTPIITQETTPGWMGSKHFLVRGLKGTVFDVDFWKGRFHIDVIWDNQTYLDDKGLPAAVRQGVYCHDEAVIIKIESKKEAVA